MTSVSDEVVLSTGWPQGCILSPLLFCLCTYEFAAHFQSSSIVKYADVITIIGLIHSYNESHYRFEPYNLIKWSRNNRSDKHSTEVTILREILNFLVSLLTILTGMSLPASFFFFFKKKPSIAFFTMKTKTFLNKIKNFIYYTWKCSYLLTYSVFSEADCARQEISEQNCPSCPQDTGTDLPDLQVIGSSRPLSRACALCKRPQPSPCHCSFPLLSGRWHRSNKCFSSRHLNNIFPSAVHNFKSHTLLYSC